MTEKYMIELDLADVTFELCVEPEFMPVRGNVMDGGPGFEAADRAAEDEILSRLDQGDVWAWAIVSVHASLGTLQGIASLGGCSYADEAEFRACGEVADLEAEALDDLRQQIKLAGGRLKE